MMTIQNGNVVDNLIAGIDFVNMQYLELKPIVEPDATRIEGFDIVGDYTARSLVSLVNTKHDKDRAIMEVKSRLVTMDNVFKVTSSAIKDHIQFDKFLEIFVQLTKLQNYVVYIIGYKYKVYETLIVAE